MGVGFHRWLEQEMPKPGSKRGPRCQRVADQGMEPVIKTYAYPPAGRRDAPAPDLPEKNQPRTKCRTMPPPNSRWSSTRGKAASSSCAGGAKSSSAPKSTNSGARRGAVATGTRPATVSTVRDIDGFGYADGHVA
jgi:hypothetical protein